ncbi:MAG: CapA family protein, partial [bacterium]
RSSSRTASSATAGSTSATAPAATAPAATAQPTGTSRPAGQFTFAFAGDVNFAERTAARLAADPSTAFGPAAAAIGRADLSMVNLETAVTTRGTPENKSFTFRAPPSAFTALRDAGVDVATMANNHAADYGPVGLRDSLAAIASSGVPTVGIGGNAAAAFAPWTATVSGTRVAVIAASQVQDETLAHFSAGADSPGIANAYSPRLITAVRDARARGYVVIVYVHWGTEYMTCPNPDQAALAERLANAGASAVVGTHAHVLQGAGWRRDGTFVAYGLSNYLWWRSFGNDQDDNGVLTLTFGGGGGGGGGKVVGAQFAPAHLDATGVPVPATGATAHRIQADWSARRQCAGLAARPPS